MKKNKWSKVVGLLVWIISISITFSSCNFTEPESIAEPCLVLYDICTEDYKVHRGELEQGQTLGAVLYLNHIDHGRIDQIVKASKGIFDFRKAKAGKKFTVLCSNDSIEKAKYFIYEMSNTDYVVFDIRDTIDVFLGQKPIEVKLRQASGQIESSLWNALINNNMSPALVMELSSNIYAWTIDFFRIQKGDYFKIVYEEKFVEGELVGIGRVHAAMFNHANEDFYAFYFEEEEHFGDYFDDEGGALRKAFLRAPLNYSRISSSYSKRRKHPVTGRIKAHLGTDYAAPTGTPILSTANGTITEARYKRNNGNYVKVRHNSTYSTQYLHMSKIKSGIRPGVYVKQGDVIGFVGSTGLATGPHVCYRFWKNGRQVDPYKQKLPPSKPVKDENREEYNLLKDSLMTVLQSIPTDF
ncbi:MAG: peptidoglycan DD-metalloendopeptidase family protein [Flavobacteriales bacterium]|jgi:murein DD-endopeptidase MepM/ murein hydrolase activator NlpD|nr:peptidoglycan DD-metalloendopeptidase family protein [Flavobacteriales bacterium]